MSENEIFLGVHVKFIGRNEMRAQTLIPKRRSQRPPANKNKPSNTDNAPTHPATQHLRQTLNPVPTNNPTPPN